MSGLIAGVAGALAHEVYRFELTDRQVWRTNRAKYLVVGFLWLLVGAGLGASMNEEVPSIWIFFAGTALPELVGFAVLNVGRVFGALTGVSGKESKPPDRTEDGLEIRSRTEERTQRVSPRDYARSWVAVVGGANTWRD